MNWPLQHRARIASLFIAASYLMMSLLFFIPTSTHAVADGCTQAPIGRGVISTLWTAGWGNNPVASNSQTQEAVQATICQPVPRIKIPGLNFTSSQTLSENTYVDPTDGSVYLFIPFIGEYIAAVYRYGIALAGVVIVLILVVSGIQWTLGGANPDNIDAAKERMRNAIIGLGIITFTYSFLYIIDPNLTSFQSLKIKLEMPVELATIIEDGSVNDTTIAQTTPISPSTLAILNTLQNTLTNLGFSANFLPQSSGIATTGIAPVDLDSDENPIPYLIGDLPANIARCSPEAAVYTAQSLDDIHVCVGSCHCAYTASHFLKYIGCNIEKDGSASDLLDNAAAAGWTYVEIDSKQDQDIPFGLVGTGPKSHVGVSLGNGLSFDSGANRPYTENSKEFVRQYMRPLISEGNSFVTLADLQPNDPDKNLLVCSRIPSQAPITGRYGANGRDFGNGIIGNGGGESCQGVQLWAIRKVEQYEWNHLYIPPTQ